MRYLYPALGARQIRLLRLAPGKKEEKLRARLETAFIDSLPPYEAVSYSWGTTGQTASLSLENEVDAEIPITDTLESALHHFRNKADDRLLWIDQLCINQNDTTEKSDQVGNFMAKIYMKAKRLLVWLGPEDQNSTLAIQTVRNACEEFRARGMYETLHQTDLSQVSLHDQDGAFRYEAWLAVTKLFQREWFSRLWVVQEVCLADTKDMLVVCGPQSLPWQELSFIHIAICRHRWNEHSSQRPLMPHVQEILTEPLDLLRRIHWEKSQEGKTMHAQDYVWRLRLRGCTEPPDRIYATREFWLEQEKIAIPVSYEQDIKDLYTTFARMCINQTLSLDILGACVPDTSLNMPKACVPGTSLNMPSWVPDWNLSAAGYPLRMLCHMNPTSGLQRFNVTPGTVATIGNHDDLRVLRLQGYVMRTVSMVSDDRAERGGPDEKTTLEDLQKGFWGMSSCMARLDSSEHRALRNPVIAPEDITKAFWTSLILGRDQFGQPIEVSDNKFDASYTSASLVSIPHRKFFITEEGDVGLGPYDIDVNDRVCLLMGGSVPFVLRPTATEGQCRLIGECYCYSLMDGHALPTTRALETFDLV